MIFTWKLQIYYFLNFFSSNGNHLSNGSSGSGSPLHMRRRQSLPHVSKTMHIGIFLGILVSWSDSLQVFTSTDRQVLLLYRLHMIIDLRDAYNYSGHYYSTGGIKRTTLE